MTCRVITALSATTATTHTTPDAIRGQGWTAVDIRSPTVGRRLLDVHGLSGARIGIAEPYYATSNNATKAAIDAAAADLIAAGATVAHATVPTFDALNAFPPCSVREQTRGRDTGCSVVLKYGFKRDFNAWLASLGARAAVTTL